jgi:hypothetical protein
MRLTRFLDSVSKHAINNLLLTQTNAQDNKTMILSFDDGDVVMAHGGFEFSLSAPNKPVSAGGTLGKNVPFEVKATKDFNGQKYICLQTRTVGTVWATEKVVRAAMQALHSDAPGIGLDA